LIQYFSHNEIDKSRWDDCILNSPNGMIYGTSWYLDQVSPAWEALVYKDYTALMPLPARRKWGINYLIRPAFCQQLGVFGKSEIDNNLIMEFIESIPSHFSWINMPLNEGNFNEGMKITKETGINYLLSLSPSYHKIHASYVQNTKRNLVKSIEKKALPVYSDNSKKFFKLKLEHAFSRLTETHMQFLNDIFERYNISGEAKIVCVLDENNEMAAGALFIHFRNRWIYLLSSSSAKGKEQRAMFAIIDKFIQDHSGKEEYLDFEGSMIPELARFFAGFGATPKYYPLLKRNKLPFPLNFIKR
jgi:hypothetical protein